MRRFRLARLALASAGVLATMLLAASASAQIPKAIRDFGAPVYPAFEGWYENDDGTATVLIGFFNSNQSETLEIPIGEQNHFSPGPEDRGQPTTFPPGRSWGVLTIEVPRDFDGELSWTLVGNDQPVTVPFHLRAAYFVEPFKDQSNNNEPPTIRFAAVGTPFSGPPVGIAHTMTAPVGSAVALPVWLSDVTPDRNVRENPFRRRPPQVLRWHKLRGPGDVEFDEPEQEFEDAGDHNPTTTITFEAAGEYWLRAEVLDSTGDGGSGFQCCWTSAVVQVTVTE
jgi:hypothetical protein